MASLGWKELNIKKLYFLATYLIYVFYTFIGTNSDNFPVYLSMVLLNAEVCLLCGRN
jgi:hypothetical protein